MATERVRVRAGDIWALAGRQHGVISHAQLVRLGVGEEAIRHRLERGRLHRLFRGVYAVGRPTVSDKGRWMAAVLACGPGALLSHRSAATLLGIGGAVDGPVEVVVPAHLPKRFPGIRAHRRSPSLADRRQPSEANATGAARHLRWGCVDSIPVTAPAVTVVDLATCSAIADLEAAVNEADHRGLIDPEALRSAIDLLPRRPGARRLRELLDSAGQALTATGLERRFLPLAIEAGLPAPETQSQLGEHRVDFFWPDLGLVVETDSLRYHRTAFKQSADKRRDNAHARSGLTTLRFSHGQVTHEPDYVRGELTAVARRLAGERELKPGLETR